MLHLRETFFGERSLTKVAAVFGSEREARRAGERVLANAALSREQVRVLGPHTARKDQRDAFGEAVEPESRGIAHTLVRSHLVLGIAGALIGLAAHVGLAAAGNPAVLGSPRASMIMLSFIGLMLGLMAGGALALRPDHAAVIANIRAALERGGWIVVAHPADATQTHRALQSLEPGSQRVLRTL